MTDYSQMSDGCINRLVSRELKIPFGDNFCNDPTEAWPVIVEACIGVIPYKSGAHAFDSAKGMLCGESAIDDNPLRAAMIVFLKMKDAKNANPI